jgi:hypothetical protein
MSWANLHERRRAWWYGRVSHCYKRRFSYDWALEGEIGAMSLGQMTAVLSQLRSIMRFVLSSKSSLLESWKKDLVIQIAIS